MEIVIYVYRVFDVKFFQIILNGDFFSFFLFWFSWSQTFLLTNLTMVQFSLLFLQSFKQWQASISTTLFSRSLSLTVDGIPTISILLRLIYCWTSMVSFFVLMISWFFSSKLCFSVSTSALRSSFSSWSLAKISSLRWFRCCSK